MTFKLALRSLASRPLRSAVLAGGFGLGIAVMASLLGIGDVILEQARSPQLNGGGDLLVGSQWGRVTHARFLMASILDAPALEGRTLVVSPNERSKIYLKRDDRWVTVSARGGIPSLEQALGDPETTTDGWTDSEADRRWTDPDPGDLLRSIDRFHAIPDVPQRAASWAEWLYFNGGAGELRFYLTFLAGAKQPGSDSRVAGVRLQIDIDGTASSYSAGAEISNASLLADAPNLAIAGSRVQLEGMRYRIDIDVPAESGGSRVTGQILLDAVPGRAFPPFTLHGSGGWQTGYVVPVLSGKLGGRLVIDGRSYDLDGGEGYHDHNWGFWQDVSWRWGRVAGDGISLVYGRVNPPADAADAERLPGFLAVLGPEGPLGFSTQVEIVEQDDPQTGRPDQIRVHARGADLELTMVLEIESLVRTRMDRGPFAPADGAIDFIQMRAAYRVKGHVGARSFDFSAPGSAETFRGR